MNQLERLLLDERTITYTIRNGVFSASAGPDSELGYLMKLELLSFCWWRFGRDVFVNI
jgi:hypothetical protein